MANIQNLRSSFPSADYIGAFTRRPANPIKVQFLQGVALLPVIQAIAALVTIASAADTSAWEGSVSSQLREIEAKLDAIRQELQSLKVWIPEVVDKIMAGTFKNVWSTDVQSYTKIADAIIRDASKIKVTQQWLQENGVQGILDGIRKTTLDLATWKTWGVSHFGEITIGFSTSFALLKLLGPDERLNQIGSLIYWVNDFFKAAIDPSYADSYISQANGYAFDAWNASAAASNRMNTWYVVFRGQAPDPNDDAHLSSIAIGTDAIAHGSPTSTFSIQTTGPCWARWNES